MICSECEGVSPHAASFTRRVRATWRDSGDCNREFPSSDQIAARKISISAQTPLMAPLMGCRHNETIGNRQRGENGDAIQTRDDCVDIRLANCEMPLIDGFVL